MNNIEPTKQMLKTRDQAKKRWLASFAKLKLHAEENGSCEVDNQENKTLSDWCSAQRKARNQAKLSPDQINMLKSIGFIWDMREHVWMQNFEEMKRFQATYGHTNPATNSKLGRWCQTQRNDRKKNKLKPERKSALISINFSWESRTGNGETNSAASMR